MKKNGWMTFLQILASFVTSVITTLGTTSCMGA